MRKYIKQSSFIDEYRKLMAGGECDYGKIEKLLIHGEEMSSFARQCSDYYTTEWYEIMYHDGSIFDFDLVYYREEFSPTLIDFKIEKFVFSYIDSNIVVNKDECIKIGSWFDFRHRTKNIPEINIILPVQTYFGLGTQHSAETEIKRQLQRYTSHTPDSILIRNNMTQMVFRLITKAGFVFMKNTTYWEYQRAAYDIVGKHIMNYYKDIRISQRMYNKLYVRGWRIMCPLDSLDEMTDIFINGAIDDDVIFFHNGQSCLVMINDPNETELTCPNGHMLSKDKYEQGKINLDEYSHITSLEANTRLLYGQDPWRRRRNG